MISEPARGAFRIAAAASAYFESAYFEHRMMTRRSDRR
jgi:hypothetical protein